MKVQLSDEAKQQAREQDTWWRENRDSARLFREELRDAQKVLRDAPKHQVYGYIDGEPVRRLLLEKTRCHIYYVVLEREKIVRVVAIWGGSREHGPKL